MGGWEGEWKGRGGRGRQPALKGAGLILLGPALWGKRGRGFEPGRLTQCHPCVHACMVPHAHAGLCTVEQTPWAHTWNFGGPNSVSRSTCR